MCVCQIALKCLTGSVYLLHGHKVHCRSVLAVVDIYCIPLGMNTIMEGKWILGSCDSEDLISLVRKEKIWILKKYLSIGQTATKRAHSNSSLF